MSSIANVRLGVCAIVYDGVTIGHTKGGAELSVKNDIQETTVDKYGSTPAKAWHKGSRVEVKATLAEYDFEQLEVLLNAATKTGTKASATITFGPPSNGDTVTVDGHVFTKVASAPGAGEFTSAAELATLINALDSVDAVNATGTITVTAASIGTYGNSIALSKTGSALSLSGATLTGGAAQLNIGKEAGYELEGGELVLSPIEAVADELDVTLYKAIIEGDSTFPYKVDGETVYDVLFVALVSQDDEDVDGKGFLARLGNES